MNRIRSTRDYTALVAFFVLTPLGWVVTTTVIVLCLTAAVYYTCVGVGKLFGMLGKLLDFTDKNAQPIITTAKGAPNESMTLAAFWDKFVITPYFTRIKIVTVPNPVDEKLIEFNSRLLDQLMKAERKVELAVEAVNEYRQTVESNAVVMQLATECISYLRAENVMLDQYNNELLDQSDLLDECERAMFNATPNVVEVVFAFASNIDTPPALTNVVEIEQPTMEDTVPDVFVRGDKVKGKYEYVAATKAHVKEGTPLFKNAKGRWRPLSTKEFNAIS